VYNPDKQIRGYFGPHYWNNLYQLQNPKLLVSPEEILDTSYVVGGIIWVNENCSVRTHARNSRLHHNSIFQKSQPLSYLSWVPVLEWISVRTILILPYRHIFCSQNWYWDFPIKYFYAYPLPPFLLHVPSITAPWLDSPNRRSTRTEISKPFLLHIFYSFLLWQHIFHNILSSDR